MRRRDRRQGLEVQEDKDGPSAHLFTPARTAPDGPGRRRAPGRRPSPLDPGRADGLHYRRNQTARIWVMRTRIAVRNARTADAVLSVVVKLARLVPSRRGLIN